MKITRAKLVLLGLFIGLVVVVSYAKRDIQLDVDLLRDTLLSMPAVVMENIQMSREISGDMWRIRLPYLDREGETLRMKSLDIRRQIHDNKGEWYFFGREGVYSNDIKAASISGLLGTLNNGSKTWNLESGRLDWQDGGGAIVFSEGFTIYDSELLIKTPMASIDQYGVILLEKGGVIQWVKPRKR